MLPGAIQRPTRCQPTRERIGAYPDTATLKSTLANEYRVEATLTVGPPFKHDKGIAVQSSKEAPLEPRRPGLCAAAKSSERGPVVTACLGAGR